MKFWFLISNFIKKRVFGKTFLFVNLVLLAVITLSIVIPSKVANKDSKTDYKNNKISCNFYSELPFTDIEQRAIIDKIKYLKETYHKIEFAFVKNKELHSDILVIISAPAINDNWQITIKGLPNSQPFKDLASALRNIHLSNVKTNQIIFEENQEETIKENKRKIILFFIIGFVAISSSISATCSQIAGTDVITDKSSRVIEQILMNVSPKQHFYSKVIGGLFFGIIQTLLMVTYVFIGVLLSSQSPKDITHVSGIFNLFNLGMPVVFASVSVILVTFFTTTLSVIIGAVANSQEEFAQIYGPLNIVIIIAFYASMFLGMQTNANNPQLITLSQVLSYLPITGLSVTPISYLNGIISWHEALVALLLQVSYIYNFLELFIPKYKRHILDYNTKINIWKRLFNKIKGKRVNK